MDRIVLNGDFALGQQGGGFRYWWRQLTGSDATLDHKHLRELAGRFSRRVPAYAKRRKIPLRPCAPGVRKHERAEQYRPTDPTFTGVFLILVAKAPALVGEVTQRAGGGPHLIRKTPWPDVNHYHFHGLDKDSPKNSMSAGNDPRCSRWIVCERGYPRWRCLKAVPPSPARPEARRKKADTPRHGWSSEIDGTPRDARAGRGACSVALASLAGRQVLGGSY